MKHPTDLQAAAKAIIEQVKYITIATVSEYGDPWNTPVFATYDEAYNFYFSTDTESHKARNIAANHKVFLVIYDSTALPGTGVGVYIQGEAVRLTTEADMRAAYTLLVARRKPVKFHAYDEYRDGPYGLYKITPRRILMNTESNRMGSYVDKKVEIILRSDT